MDSRLGPVEICARQNLDDRVSCRARGELRLQDGQLVECCDRRRDATVAKENPGKPELEGRPSNQPCVHAVVLRQLAQRGGDERCHTAGPERNTDRLQRDTEKCGQFLVFLDEPGAERSLCVQDRSQALLRHEVRDRQRDVDGDHRVGVTLAVQPRVAGGDGGGGLALPQQLPDRRRIAAQHGQYIDLLVLRSPIRQRGLGQIAGWRFVQHVSARSSRPGPPCRCAAFP